MFNFNQNRFSFDMPSILLAGFTGAFTALFVLGRSLKNSLIDTLAAVGGASLMSASMAKNEAGQHHSAEILLAGLASYLTLASPEDSLTQTMEKTAAGVGGYFFAKQVILNKLGGSNPHHDEGNYPAPNNPNNPNRLNN